MVALAGDRTMPPLLLDNVGRIFFNETSYFTCDIDRTGANANTLNGFIGPMHSFEAWFRLDPLDKRPDGYISTIFAVLEAATGDYVYGLRISNEFLRIHMADVIHDVQFNFTEEATDYWHYVAISTTRVH